LASFRIKDSKGRIQSDSPDSAHFPVEQKGTKTGMGSFRNFPSRSSRPLARRTGEGKVRASADCTEWDFSTGVMRFGFLLRHFTYLTSHSFNLSRSRPGGHRSLCEERLSLPRRYQTSEPLAKKKTETSENCLSRLLTARDIGGAMIAFGEHPLPIMLPSKASNRCPPTSWKGLFPIHLSAKLPLASNSSCARFGLPLPVWIL
jgi:hypothetical protein